MIRPESDKDLLLRAVLASVDDPRGIGAWNVDAERDSILFDMDGTTFRVRTHGGVEETDGHVASFTPAARRLEEAVRERLAEFRYGAGSHGLRL